jgi:hypothetical protein
VAHAGRSEPPSKFEPDAIRDEKRKVLRALRLFTEAEVATHTVRGQYRAGVVGIDRSHHCTRVPARHVWHVAKLYNDLGSASGQPFARAQIARHASPTPIGDLTLDRDKSFGRAIFSRLATSGSLPTG